MHQFLPNLRADEFNAAQLHVGLLSFQGFQNRGALGRRALPGMQRQPDHDVVRSAEVLHLEVGIAQRIDRMADFLDLRGLCVMHLHDRAAGEFDRQMKAPGNDEKDGGDKGDQADQVEHQRVAHERYGAVDAEKFHVSSCLIRERGGTARRAATGLSLSLASRSGRWTRF